MCIRDSISAVRVRAACGKAAACMHVPEAGNHARDDGQRRLGRMIELRQAADETLRVAVSYTHLDVYKRQPRERS